MPDSQLEAVYRQTVYWVDSPSGRIAIRVDQVCPQIDAYSWAFLTACNPRSVPLSPPENTARMAQLESSLQESGYTYLPGEGVGEDPAWPSEPSFLVLNIDESAAVELARHFDQHAIVFARRGEPARLVWIDDCVPPSPP